MNQSRRSFLHSLGLLAFAPVALSRALTSRPPIKVIHHDVVTPDMEKLMGEPLLSPEASRVFVEKGRTIKVPSNRYTLTRKVMHPTGEVATVEHFYYGDWDGTFKLEEGCTNPAYVLADLETHHRLTTLNGGYFGAPLDWRALYDYGCHCDELIVDPESFAGGGPAYGATMWKPRRVIDPVCVSPAETDDLREVLRMRFMVWKATDPRYRRSFPGIPYSET